MNSKTFLAIATLLVLQAVTYGQLTDQQAERIRAAVPKNAWHRKSPAAYLSGTRLLWTSVPTKATASHRQNSQ